MPRAAAAAEVSSGAMIALLLGTVITLVAVWVLATSLLTKRLRGPQRPRTGLAAAKQL